MVKRNQAWQDLGWNLAPMIDCSYKITTKQVDIRMSGFFLKCMKMGSSQILVRIRPK